MHISIFGCSIRDYSLYYTKRSILSYFDTPKIYTSQPKAPLHKYNTSFIISFTTYLYKYGIKTKSIMYIFQCGINKFMNLSFLKSFLYVKILIPE